jgi:hypothetical protein
MGDEKCMLFTFMDLDPRQQAEAALREIKRELRPTMRRSRKITRRLGLSPSIVRNNITVIFGKIDVHTRSSAIVWARERGVTGGRAGSVDKASARTHKS